jgi:hypothetical protein
MDRSPPGPRAQSININGPSCSRETSRRRSASHLPHSPPCAPPHPPPPRRAVRLSLSLPQSPLPPLSLCPLVARRRWCREPCAGAGGGRGAAGGGAGRSAAWAASWRYKSGEQGRSSDGRFAGDEGPAGGNAFLFPSLPILLRSLGVFVFGSDRDFTNPICLQQLLGVHVYTHVLC